METQAAGSEGAEGFSGEGLEMRRTLIITAVVQGLNALCAQAGKLPFEQEDAEPFYSPKLQIVWAVTNKLPSTATIFKVVPAGFSPSAISNLTAMGGSADSKRGWMNLYRPTDARLPLEKVPDKARAYELGTNFLAKLEIPVGELMAESGKPVAWYSHGTRGHMDKATRKMITEPCMMGIEFRRVLGGLTCFGQQVRFQFESQETLTQLEVRWHGLQSASICAVASADQLVSWIKEGRARAQAVETTGSRWIKVADIKKVTIRNIQLCYDAEPDWENPNTPRDYLYPYALLTTEVELAPSDYETLGLFCPIIKEALSRPVRESSEFNIFPSTLFEKQGQKEGGD